MALFKVGQCFNDRLITDPKVTPQMFTPPERSSRGYPTTMVELSMQGTLPVPTLSEFGEVTLSVKIKLDATTLAPHRLDRLRPASPLPACILPNQSLRRVNEAVAVVGPARVMYATRRAPGRRAALRAGAPVEVPDTKPTTDGRGDQRACDG